MSFLKQAFSIALGVLVPPLLFWIVNGSLLLVIQKAAGLQPFSMFWARPIWPIQIAVPAYFIASLGGVAAVHVLITRTVRLLTQWSSLTIVICTNLFLFPIGIFGAYGTLFPSAGIFSTHDWPSLVAFMVLVIAPCLSFVGLEAARRTALSEIPYEQD